MSVGTGTDTVAVVGPRARPVSRSHPGGVAVFAGWVVRHARDLAWSVPTIAVTVVVLSVDLVGNPQRIDDEGTYTAQAWSVFHLGSLTHYTYWYDHPPMGWVQIALYTGLTDAWGRHALAVGAARESMVFFAAVSVALLFALARKLRVSRPAATAAVLLFALSPLAVQYHRDVYIDNVATPWVIAAFLLALTRGPQLLGFAGSAACLAMAVLSKETFLLALPFVAWTMIRGSHHSNRRYTLSVAAAVLVLGGGSYLVLAAVKGELLPGSGHVSLWQGITFQLGSRNGSGSLFDPTSPANHVAGLWWALDPALLTLGTVASVVGLAFRRIRPISAMLVFLILMMLRPNGYLPVPYVIVLVPFAALVAAAIADRAARALVAPRRRRIPVLRVLGALWLVGCAATLVVAVPAWTAQLTAFMTQDPDAPMADAESWIGRNVPRDARLLVDDAMWVDLIDDGFPRDDVIWYYKLDTDPAVAAQSPHGWRDADYVVTTESMGIGARSLPDIRAAIRNSTPVAVFGTGGQAVTVRRVDPAGIAHARAASAAALAERRTLGGAVVRNPALTAPDVARGQLWNGQVDARVALALGAMTTVGPVTLRPMTAEAGETGLPYRRVTVTAASPGAAASMADVVAQMSGAAAAAVVRRGAEVTVTFPVAAGPASPASQASDG